jgi:hypothetical protein
MLIYVKLNCSKRKSILIKGLNILILSFISQISIAQVTSFETISTFAVFTSVGSISSSGNTVINGNLGTNNGSITGFPSGTVTGTIHEADSVSAQAALEVDSAYNFFLNTGCDTTISDTFGNNQVLTPKVYCIGSAAFINGKLILDGLGNPNSIFIFKIDGALTTSIASSIVLINSASKCNIYWQVNGLFTLEDSSIFKGTLIANGAINLLDTTQFDGRALTRSGAITLNSANVDMVCGITFLPVELLTFDAECSNNKAILSWSTASETNNDFYLVERSTNALHWEEIGNIAGSNNSYTLTNYTFADNAPLNNVSYYRLKQTDFNGNYTNTNIIALENCRLNPFKYSIFPNPANEYVNVLLNSHLIEFNSITIYSSLGVKIYFSEKYQSIIDLNNVADGIYFFHLSMKTGDFIEKIIVKKR